MKWHNVICLSVIMTGLAVLPGWAEEENADERWQKNVTKIYAQTRRNFAAEYLKEIEEYVTFMNKEGDSSLSLNDEGVELFLELEISDSFQTMDTEFSPEALNDLLYADPEIPSPIPVEIAWKWGVTNLTLDYGNEYGRSEYSLPPAGSMIEAEDVYVAAAELSGTVANVDVYTEFGITGGRIDPYEETELTAEEIDEAIDLDLSGYYVAGGASMGIGQWKVGVEAGYGSRGNGSGETKQAGISQMTSSTQLTGHAGGGQPLAENSSTSAADALKDDPFKLVYLQGIADRSVTERLGLKLGAICFAVPEKFVSDFAGNESNGYGFEIFGDVNYQFARYIRYSLFLDYALTDKNFEEENIYQILNKVEFNF